MKLFFMWTIQCFNPDIGTLISSCLGQVTFYKQRFSQPQLLLVHIFLSLSCPVSTLWKCLFFSLEGKCLPQTDYLQTDYLLMLWHPCPSPASLKIQTHTVQVPRSDQRKHKFFFCLGHWVLLVSKTVTSTVTEVLQDKSKPKEKKNKVSVKINLKQIIGLFPFIFLCTSTC